MGLTDSTKIVTMNELIKKFNVFSDNHQQLMDFGYGPTSEIGVSRKMSFPYLWVTHRSPSTIVVSNKSQIPEMSLTFIVVDQINSQKNYLEDNGLDSDNQQEIISDTLQIVQDLINYISSVLRLEGVKLMDDNISIEPTFDDTDDRVTGWVADISLKLIHFNCSTPIV
jgi:hypothetical protein